MDFVIGATLGSCQQPSELHFEIGVPEADGLAEDEVELETTLAPVDDVLLTTLDVFDTTTIDDELEAMIDVVDTIDDELEALIDVVDDNKLTRVELLLLHGRALQSGLYRF